MSDALAEPVLASHHVSTSSVLRRADRTAWQSFDDRVVVLDIPSRTMLGLNPSAAQVWQALDGVRDVNDIALALAQAHGLPHTRALSDVIAFAEALLARGCIEQVLQPSAANAATGNS